MSELLGVVLAGGASRRMGAAKAVVELAGAPLIARPLAAMRDAGLESVVVAKPATELPPVDVAVWDEPVEPSHPLTGIVAALERGGRPLVVCGCDLPFVPATLLGHLAQRVEPLLVVAAAGRVHPLVGRYDPRLTGDLCAARDEHRALHEVVAELHGALVDASRFGDPLVVTFNVNTRADLARAEQLLAGG